MDIGAATREADRRHKAGMDQQADFRCANPRITVLEADVARSITQETKE